MSKKTCARSVPCIEEVMDEQMHCARARYYKRVMRYTEQLNVDVRSPKIASAYASCIQAHEEQNDQHSNN